MRSCDETLELLSAALDGALTGDEQTALDEHLAHCSACSTLFQELRALQEAAAGLDELPAPAGFTGRVMASIAADPAQEKPDNVIAFPSRKASRTPWKRWAASAAVVAVVVLGAIALPDQMKSANNTADFDAAPAVADMAYTSESAQAQMDAALFDAADAYTEGGYSTAQITNGGAEADHSYHTTAENATPQEETEEKDSGISPSAAPAVSYCGVLTLAADSLPDGLDAYAYTQDEQGDLTYTVPADYFFDAARTLDSAELERFKTALDLGGYDPDAEYGLIIVESPS